MLGFEPNFEGFAFSIMAWGSLIALISLLAFFIIGAIEHFLQDHKNVTKLLREKAGWIVIGYFFLMITFLLTAGFIVVSLAQGIRENNYFNNQYIYFYLFIYCFLWFISYSVYDLDFEKITDVKRNVIALCLIILAIVSPVLFLF